MTKLSTQSKQDIYDLNKKSLKKKKKLCHTFTKSSYSTTTESARSSVLEESESELKTYTKTSKQV